MIREEEARKEHRQRRFHIHIIGVDVEGKQTSGFELMFKTIIRANILETKEDLNLQIQRSTVYLEKWSWNSRFWHILGCA